VLTQLKNLLPQWSARPASARALGAA
jgi:hypothetical protein